jgi:hypothetical protein
MNHNPAAAAVKLFCVVVYAIAKEFLINGNNQICQSNQFRVPNTLQTQRICLETSPGRNIPARLRAAIDGIFL